MADPFEYEIVILDEGNAGSAFRTYNPKNKDFRRVLQQTPSSQNPHLTAKIRIEDLVHGKLSDGSDATLVIVKFWFHRHKQRYRFKHVRIQLQFHDAKSPGNNDPRVVSLYPEGVWYLYPKTAVEDVNTKKEGTLGMQASPHVPFAASISYMAERTKKKEKVYSSMFTGMSRILKEFGDDEDAAEWFMEENQDPDNNDGVPSQLQTAVLLGLSSDDPFSMTLTVSCTPDRNTGTQNRLFGYKLIEDIDPVVIHREKEQLPKGKRPGSVLTEVERGNLDELDLSRFGKVEREAENPVAAK